MTADSGPDLAVVEDLFREYARGLGVDLGFEGFEEEVTTLPGAYAPPRGTLLLAFLDDAPVGCAGVRPLPEGPAGCELKRLYLRPTARGRGLGRHLLARAIEFGTAAGYPTLWLDTLPTMPTAIALYRATGFVEVPPYHPGILPGTRYFRLDLHGPSPRGTSK